MRRVCKCYLSTSVFSNQPGVVRCENTVHILTSHIDRNRNFASIIEIFQANCFYRVNFMAVAREEYSFSILAVVIP